MYIAKTVCRIPPRSCLLRLQIECRIKNFIRLEMISYGIIVIFSSFFLRPTADPAVSIDGGCT